MSDDTEPQGNASTTAGRNASAPNVEAAVARDVTSDTTGLPLDPRFEGSFPNAYRIDSDGALRFANAAYPSETQFVDQSKITAFRIWPTWINAPAQIYDKQDKVQAFVRLRVAQDDIQKPMKSPLSWSGIYSLLTAEHQNLNPSHAIGSDSETQGTLDGIVLPNGAGDLAVALWAIIGPPSKTFWTIWSSTWQRLMNVANNQVGSKFLPVPAASLAVANEVEQLLGEVVLAFASNSTQQRWITDDNTTTLQFANSTGNGNGQTIVVPANARTKIILVPDLSQVGDRPQIDAAVRAGTYPQLTSDTGNPQAYSYSEYLLPYMAGKSKAQTFSIGGSGEVSASGDNPFAYLPYLTIECIANATTAPNG